MYQDHFGLQRHLFEEGIAQGGDVFLGAPQMLAVTNLGVALTLRDSVAMLVGPSGVGKTTLAAHTLRALTTRLALGWIGTAPATGHELLEMLLTEFGFSPYKNSRVERLQIWRQYLNEMRATDTRVCVLVESAENLQLDVLAALESLTAADPNGCPGANVVLTSRTALTDRLAEPALAALKQRTRLRWNLEPLTRVDLRDYLSHCVTSAGGKTAKLFTDDAIDALHQYSAGIIRTANNLCATALTLAASAREPQVSAALITQVAVDVFGLAPAPAVATTPWPTVAQAERKAAQAPPAPAPLPMPATAPRAATPAPAAPTPVRPSLAAPTPATPPPATPARRREGTRCRPCRSGRTAGPGGFATASGCQSRGAAADRLLDSGSNSSPREVCGHAAVACARRPSRRYTRSASCRAAGASADVRHETGHGCARDRPGASSRYTGTRGHTANGGSGFSDSEVDAADIDVRRSRWARRLDASAGATVDGRAPPARVDA
jgi:type II secretory pathway predicted ATPase ExeA